MVQVESLMVEEREAAQSAAQAEEVANTAMKAAEQAVREEMEAAAVRKETKKALEQAMANLQDLGISFAEVDEQAVREREKLIEKNKVTPPCDNFDFNCFGLQLVPEQLLAKIKHVMYLMAGENLCSFLAFTNDHRN